MNTEGWVDGVLVGLVVIVTLSYCIRMAWKSFGKKSATGCGGSSCGCSVARSPIIVKKE